MLHSPESVALYEALRKVNSLLYKSCRANIASPFSRDKRIGVGAHSIVSFSLFGPEYVKHLPGGGDVNKFHDRSRRLKKNLATFLGGGHFPGLDTPLVVTKREQFSLKARGDLDQLLKSPDMRERKHQFFIIRQLLSILEKLHQEEIVHLDIKPCNILLYENNCVKLSDLEAARSLENKSPQKEFICTPAYCSPEYAKIMGSSEGDIDLKAYDIWSLGVTFFELLTGKKFIIECCPGLLLLDRNSETARIAEILKFLKSESKEIDSKIDTILSRNFSKDEDASIKNFLKKLLAADSRKRAPISDLKLIFSGIEGEHKTLDFKLMPATAQAIPWYKSVRLSENYRQSLAYSSLCQIKFLLESYSDSNEHEAKERIREEVKEWVSIVEHSNDTVALPETLGREKMIASVRKFLETQCVSESRRDVAGPSFP